MFGNPRTFIGSVTMYACFIGINGMSIPTIRAIVPDHAPAAFNMTLVFIIP